MKPALVLLLSASCAFAGVKMPAVISDHMVLQGNAPVTIWGWADANEPVQVDFAGQTKSTQTSADGKWQVKLDKLQASAQPQTLTVSGTNKITIQDVLIGEVWLASGQSNMEMRIKDKMHGLVDNADTEIAAAKHPEIRVFVHDAPYEIYQQPVPADEPAQDRLGSWRVCSPETVSDFSAMAYFFARDLLAEIKQPVGILTSAVGGTPIEAWTSASAQQATPELQPLLEDWKKRLAGFDPAAAEKKFLEDKAAWLKTRAAALKAKQPAPKAPLPFKNIAVMKPGGLFNSMISPLVPYTIRGIIWYQGERNAAGPFTTLYGTQLRTLIADWRARWSDDFHFAYVQLPAVKGLQKLPSEPKGWGVAVRDLQRRTLSIPHTSMAITMDLGGELNGHPTNKSDYAKRLSTIVLHDVYQKKITQPTGPLFKTATIEKNQITLTFDFADGLKAKTSELEGFAIAGADGKFLLASAKIEDSKVIVWNDKIPEPKVIHYSFAGMPKGNLVNAANLPASPFRTDDWK
jgi:sialate O-acetylesterase